MPLTLEDIAKISGYSRSTVSRVINGDENVSEQAREKISQIIGQMDFQPNLAARGLAVGRTNVLGLVIPMGVQAIFTDPFFLSLIQGVSSGCNARDYSVMLWLAEPEYERRTIKKILYNGLADGVILASMLVDDPIVEALVQSKLPYVLVGRHPVYPEVSYVDSDNRSGAREAVTHLLRGGKRKIGTITGPLNMIAGMDRYQGYVEALRDRGILVNPDLVVESDFTNEGGFHAAQKLMLQKPEAIFAASDSMALGALRAIKAAGLRVPDDIALVGFDDIPTASTATPPLTTMRQPTQRVGAMAAEMLIDMIQKPSRNAHHMVLSTELIVRASCGVF